MSQIENALHTPYGAYALKATYQRNLMLGNLVVVLLVAALLVTSWTLLRGDDLVVVTPIDDSDDNVIDLSGFDQTSIVWEQPVGSGAAVPAGVLGIPVPMPDTAVADPDQVIMSTADKASLVDWNGLIDVGAGGGRLEVNTNLPDAFPPIDSFFIVEHKPVLVHSVKPEYPHFAQQAGLEGTVWIKALVDIEGKVRDAVVYRSSETPDLDEAALKVAWDYLYKPANQNGQPVAVWVTYRVDFDLDD